MEVVSLYDYSTICLHPWAARGYKCFAYDIKHTTQNVDENGITKIRADLHDDHVLEQIISRHRGHVYFMCAFPVCTDLAVSGAPSFKQKYEMDSLFQERASRHAIKCEAIALALGCTRFYIENPVGRLSTLWRKPDYYFHPHQFGGYIESASAQHPIYPDYIPDYDAYTKKTCLWCGVDFVFPIIKPVEPEFVTYGKKKYSNIHGKLGGKSNKTKEIRSCTPRGFSEAIFLANQPK